MADQGLQQGGDAKASQAIQKNKGHQDQRTHPRTKRFRGRTKMNLFVYYWNGFEICSPHQKKIPKDAPNLNVSPQIPPPTSFVLIFQAWTHGPAHARTNTWICGAPHSSTQTRSSSTTSSPPVAVIPTSATSKFPESQSHQNKAGSWIWTLYSSKTLNKFKRKSGINWISTLINLTSVHLYCCDNLCVLN